MKDLIGSKKLDKTYSVASLICGLLFFVPLFNMVLGPLALSFGIVSLKKIDKEPLRYGGKTMAIVGIVLGSVAVIFTLIYVYLRLFRSDLLVPV